MPRRIRLGSVTGDALQSLDDEIGTDNANGNNPDNDLVARDSNGNIVLRYDESNGTWVLEGAPIVLPQLASDPTSPSNGEIWYRSDTDEYRAQQGGSTVTFDTTAV